MFGCWETLHIIKHAIEASGYKSATDADRKALVEATEAMTEFPEGQEHPQGRKIFNGKIHQSFGHQNISRVEGGKLNVVTERRSRTGCTSRKRTTRRCRFRALPYTLDAR
jgi:branched-chain amino acid transport system substrate-binding protein